MNTISISKNKISDGDSGRKSKDSSFSYSQKRSQLEVQRSVSNFCEIGDVEKPIQVIFKDIRFTVTQKKKKIKEILHRISGYASPGRMLAILGASGAGKSSFLSVIAGRLRSYRKLNVTGEILLNGESVSTQIFEQNAAYVMQEDVHFDTITPREAITLSARLRLPKKMPKKDKIDRVNVILKALNLEKCADTYTGGISMKGISGGERKRLSIGIELVINPTLLLVDEPTSGLDSVTALKTMQVLSDLAKSGRTVITTIHQPNSDIFAMFDDLCLVSEGEIVYLGPAEQSVEYFAKLGYQCPQFTNPADYLIDIIQIGNEPEKDREKIADFAQLYRSKLQDTLTRITDENKDLTPLKEKSLDEAGRVGRLKQCQLLYIRCIRVYFREPVALRLRFVQSIFFSLLVGIVFFNLSHDPRSINAIMAVLFFCALNQSMMTATSVILTFPSERKIFLRERGNGMYSTVSYFFSKVLCEIPIQIILVSMFTAIFYPMVKLGPTVYQWFMVCLTLIMASVVSYSLGLLIGAVTTTREMATAALPLIIIPFMMFSGFLVSVDDMQVWFSWLTFISYIRYLFEMLVYTEFNFNFTPDCSESPQTCPYSSGDEVLAYYGYENVNYWAWLGVTIAMFIIFLSAALIVLEIHTMRVSSRPLKKEKIEVEYEH